jgi:hypothetical protein
LFARYLKVHEGECIMYFKNIVELAKNLRHRILYKLVVIICLCVVLITLGLLLPKVVSKNNVVSRGIESPSDEVVSDLPEGPITKQKDEQEPKQLPIIDLSGSAVDLETEMLQINEPTPYGRELLYSAGSASSIDGPVLTRLFLYNLDTRQETQVAETKVKFGEIYEGRFNADWIVWLDTNQSGTNYIYALNRKTGEVSQVKRCDLNKPQLVLYGDNLVWVEQKDEENDRLYLYNFKSGEPVVLDSFNNPTYGTCPPALYDDVLVWVYPSLEDASRSIIKKLDLKKALTAGAATGQDAVIESAGSEPAGEPADMSANDMPLQEENADVEAEPVAVESEGMSAQGEGEDGVAAEQVEAQGVEPQIIDPQGFAIYPQTNGEVIAWLDNLDPSRARLLMTRDDGKTIKVVAQGVGRLFGVGDKFIVYTQNDSIMLYFWAIDRYARLTKPGEKGMLSKACVSGNVVIWYDISDPSQRKDKVKVSIVEQPDI